LITFWFHEHVAADFHSQTPAEATTANEKKIQEIHQQQGLLFRNTGLSTTQQQQYNNYNYTLFQQERNPRREPLPNHYQWFQTK
jgi:hypothetical protein